MAKDSDVMSVVPRLIGGLVMFQFVMVLGDGWDGWDGWDGFGFKS